ncbi:hypothetical protein [Staphylococcus sp. 11261D007BR]
MKELMTNQNKRLQRLFELVSFRVILFLGICFIMLFIGVMFGLLLNHDNIWNVFSYTFWQHIVKAIGGK